MRFAEKGDFPAVRALWETCFPDEGGFNNYFFAHFYKEKYTLLYLEGETLVAMVQMLPYRMTVGGVSREVTYIYGACTDRRTAARGIWRGCSSVVRAGQGSGAHCVRADSGRKVAV